MPKTNALRFINRGFVLTMKLLPIIGALLLSTAPAIADEFLYMACKYEVNIRNMRLPSKEIIDEQDLEDIMLFKVDLTNKRIRLRRNPTWDDISVRNNQIIYDIKTRDDGSSFQGTNVIPLNPPGPSYSDWQARIPKVLRVGKAKGECVEIEPSVFEKGFNQ